MNRGAREAGWNGIGLEAIIGDGFDARFMILQSCQRGDLDM
jgi:hypothetical protein